ncbi:MAG TPA: hypothetical protein VJH65_03615 [Candidatus Nanoarchaeia archaeon]|nr:hypothetical protein [Candidatus Woesearchaeota archaeon]HLC87334.1 hypothetical protein [Candidatus Nanoarchaeia archaeon]
MKEEEIVEYVEACIEKVALEYGNFPDSFDSEGDLRAYLYHLIAKNTFFTDLFDYEGEDETFKTKYLHAEYPTFSKIKQFTGHFDLTMLNPDQSNQENDNLICIELKRRRFSSLKSIEAIRKDIQKLSNKQNDIKYKYLLLFRTNILFNQEDKDEISALKRNSDIKIYLVDTKGYDVI